MWKRQQMDNQTSAGHITALEHSVFIWSSCLEYQVLFTLVVPLFFLSSCSDYRSTVSSSVLIPLLRHLSLNVHVCRCAPTVAYVKDRRST